MHASDCVDIVPHEQKRWRAADAAGIRYDDAIELQLKVYVIVEISLDVVDLLLVGCFFFCHTHRLREARRDRVNST